jgi:hypothetical protein
VFARLHDGSARCRYPLGLWILNSGSQFARAVGKLFAATAGRGFLNGFLDRFTGFTRALLDAAQQFFLLSFGPLKIGIREFGPLLFQFALGDIPVAFDFKFIHLFFFRLVHRQHDGKTVRMICKKQNPSHPINRLLSAAKAGPELNPAPRQRT